MASIYFKLFIMKMSWLARAGFCLPACFILCMLNVSAQTDMDGIMMRKNNFCSGFQYSYSSWDHYWEGTLKRNNENLGTVSTQMIGYMGSYGITNKINALFSLPWVKTKASDGTLHGQDGLQDLSLAVKYNAYERKIAGADLKLIGVASFSFPVTNYVADFLPMSIGMRSKNLTLRVIGDYEIKQFFVTGAAAYVYRSNMKIDRSSYYTTEMHYTNEVEMPDAFTYQFHAGYRGKVIGAEAYVSRWKTLGGFDITRNNMPFPSNEMNATMIGINLKCNPHALPGLGLMAGGNYTVAGRNVGQATTIMGGITYVLDFNHKTKSSTDKSK
jgi:hypothetical protein